MLGFEFVRIEPNGDIQRCGAVWKLGNILDGTFTRRSGPAPCNTDYCYYFCRKYSKPVSSQKNIGTDKGVRKTYF